MPGFFVLLERFPGWERFILEGEGATFSPGRPLLFGVTDRSVGVASVGVYSGCVQRVCIAGMYSGYTYLGAYSRVYTYLGAYSRVYSLPGS